MSLENRSVYVAMSPPESVVELWIQYEKLLKEAVFKNHYSGLVKLLENESTIQYLPEFKRRCYLPLTLAIENNNVPMINLFREHGYGLKKPLCTDDDFDEDGEENTYDDVKRQVALLKALSNPVWISLTAEDPFLTSFKLCGLNRDLQHCADSLRVEYEKIYQATREYGSQLLDEVRTHEEGATVMRCKKYRQRIDSNELSFINLALDYDQEEVIAHPCTQHFLTSTVFGQIPGWKTSGVFYKVFVGILLGMLFPITTTLDILLPSTILPTFATLATKPFVKFVNGLLSFVTFLVCLSVFCALDPHGIRTQEEPQPLEIIIFIYLLGFCFGECKQLYKSGIKGYFSSGWNWVDVGMDVMLLFSFIVWIVLYFYNPEKTGMSQLAYEHTKYVADFTFVIAVVLSFFRIIYICQITRHLGLIQICVGEMIMVICQFAFICVVVLISFSFGMLYLSNATPKDATRTVLVSQRVKKMKFLDSAAYANSTAIYKGFQESFKGLFSTVVTMVYVSLTLQGTETLKNFHDGTLVELWANLIFMCYYCITMIIVINILIAMMNSSYQSVADNMDRWFLNSRTKLWMEYVSNNQSRPVPFNLLPTMDELIHGVKKIYSHVTPADRNAKKALKTKEIEKYNEVCRNLTKRHLRNTLGSCNYADPPVCDIDTGADPFLKKIEALHNAWKRLSKRLSGVNNQVFEDPPLRSNHMNNSVNGQSSHNYCPVQMRDTF